ncbi:MAG: histidine kinase [Bacteroidota bacterium]
MNNRFYSRYEWVFRYKLYHLPFWMLYHYLWWALRMGSIWEAANSIFFSVYLFKFTFYVLFQALGVYFNLYYLIPKFLEKGRYGIYIGLLLLTCVSTAAFITSGYYASAWWSDQSFQELYQVSPDQYFYLFKTNALPSTVASMTLAMSIKLTKNWVQAQRKQQALERKQQVLEKEKLETELKFLKSQFNPHFLFNSINSIFVLIHKNPDEASESLAKFSDLLRYQLYECNEQQIPLDRELTYLENFIELAKLRQDHHVVVNVHLEPLRSGDLAIAPFILMPFVENAFKHVSQHPDDSNWISINIALEKHRLQVDIVNSTAELSESIDVMHHYRGIGLRNVRRRLDLLYPEQYDLSVQTNDQQFKVHLTLELQLQAYATQHDLLLKENSI